MKGSLRLAVAAACMSCIGGGGIISTGATATPVTDLARPAKGRGRNGSKQRHRRKNQRRRRAAGGKRK